ncbi:MAG: hypothetical protein AAGJ35_14780, partial [Myxococcota bacterium]
LTPTQQGQALKQRQQRIRNLRPWFERKRKALRLSSKAYSAFLPGFFHKTHPTPRIHVTMQIKASFFKRLGTDSMALLKGRGFLGVAEIELTLTRFPKHTRSLGIQPGATIAGKSFTTVVEVLDQVGRLSFQIQQAIRSANTMLQTLGDPHLSKNLKQIAEHLDQLLLQARKGPGWVHELLRLRKWVNLTQNFIREVNRTLKVLGDTEEDIHRFLIRIQRRQTFAYQLLLSTNRKALLQKAEALLRQTHGTIRTLKSLAQKINTPNHLLYDLWFTTKANPSLDSWLTVSEEIVRILDNMHKAKGTLGLLIYDATLHTELVRYIRSYRDNRWVKTFINLIKENKELE